MDKAIIINHAFSLFFDDDSSDDEKEEFRSSIVKNENYAEEVLPRLSDRTFKTHFRMNPDVFEIICGDIHSIQGGYYGPGRSLLLIEKQLMITLWYLGNPECMR